jgi:hypothetical protein
MFTKSPPLIPVSLKSVHGASMLTSLKRSVPLRLSDQNSLIISPLLPCVLLVLPVSFLI